MLNRSGIFSEWAREYCSPVVLVATTPTVENICFKNGVLLHELLSAFGHLDGINAVVRCPGNPPITLTDAHIRFERVTEARPKSPSVIEELLKTSFDDCNIDSFPSTISELKGSPPSSWNHKIEQILLRRSLSFSEYEMLSAPMVIMTVVSSSEVDPIQSMQELLSHHNMAQCFLNGQYDPEVNRVFLVLHDVADSSGIDPDALLRKMQSKFSPLQTRLLRINSLSSEQLNLQQPDLWSNSCIPHCYPQYIPPVDEANKPRNPDNGRLVMGSRLAIEDFIVLRDFCIVLFHQDVTPVLERRIINLTRIINDARKGVKNVLKSFWRRSRDEPTSPTSSKSGNSVRYRFDRIESQIMHLADISFIVNDYENALSNYKLVRDDFKADKSTSHLIHTYVMIAVILMINEPSRVRDAVSHIETAVQLIQTSTEPPHVVAYYAILMAEIYTSKECRQFLDAAQLMLIAASQASKYPVLCALLSEKAACYFLLGGYSRRYVLYNILAGYKLRSVGGRASTHAIINFATALLFVENGHWGDIKAKLWRAIAQELKLFPSDINRAYDKRSLVASLQNLYIVLNEDLNVGSRENLSEAISVLEELTHYQPSMLDQDGRSMTTKFSKGWSSFDIHDVFVSSLPIAEYPTPNKEATVNFFEINELPFPEINLATVCLMIPFNGVSTCVPWDSSVSIIAHSLNSGFRIPSPNMFSQAEEMKLLSDIELSWAFEYQDVYSKSLNVSSQQPSKSFCVIRSLGSRWVEAESFLLSRKYRYFNKNFQSYLSINMPMSKNSLSSIECAQIPKDELVHVHVQFKNKLASAVSINDIKIAIEPEENFEFFTKDVALNAGETKQILLSFKPLTLGSYSIDKLTWKLSNSLLVSKSIRKQGTLLQKTQINRSERQRTEDKSLMFEVVDPAPLITMTFEGVSEEVLQGQLLKTSLLIRNNGTSCAKDIFLKMSQPCFVFTYLSPSQNDDSNSLDPQIPSLMDVLGQSCTLIRLPEGAVIPPQGEYRLQAWLRLTSLGKQIISVLATYSNKPELGSNKLLDPRTSYVSVQTTVITSASLSVQVTSNPSSFRSRMLFVEINNALIADSPSSLKFRERNSSVGQIDISDDFLDLGINDVPLNRVSSFSADGDDSLEEGMLKIEGIWTLGCAIADLASNSAFWKSFTAANAERITVPVPITITDKTMPSLSYNRIVNTSSAINTSNVSRKSSRQLKGFSSWPIPLSTNQPSKSIRGSISGSTAPITPIHLSSLLERFISMAYAHKLFRRDIREAEYKASLENSESVPRSITQVRKERQKEVQSTADALADIDLNTDDIEESFSGPASSSGYPTSASDLAAIEAQGGSLNVMVVWKCKWQGKLRLGMHSVSNVSVIPVDAIFESSKKKKLPNISDYILTSVSHADKITLPSSGSNPSDGALIPVTVELHSVSVKTIFVNVEVVDRKEIPKETIQNSSPPTNQQSDSNDDINGSVSASSSRGFNWRGKTKYHQLEMKPFSNLKLSFQAFITHAGIFDLKRFRIAVIEADANNAIGEPDKFTYKALPGQSLIEVYESNISATLHESTEF